MIEFCVILQEQNPGFHSSRKAENIEVDCRILIIT